MKAFWPLTDSILIDIKFKDSQYENFTFDETHLITTRNRFFEDFENRLGFIKHFEDTTEAENFHFELLRFYNKKYGSFEAKKDFFTQIWYGDKINLSIVRVKNDVILLIKDLDKRYNISYESSFSFKFDYYYTSVLFKNIDIDNSYRGLKFGTPLNIIKGLGVELTKTTSNYQYIIESLKQRSWNNISFDDVRLNLTSDFKLASIYLMSPLDKYDNPITYNKITEYQKVVEKIKNLLGEPSKWIDGLYIWEGKNIKIFISDFDNNNSEDDIFQLGIQSKKYLKKVEKQY